MVVVPSALLWLIACAACLYGGFRLSRFVRSPRPVWAILLEKKIDSTNALLVALAAQVSDLPDKIDALQRAITEKKDDDAVHWMELRASVNEKGEPFLEPIYRSDESIALSEVHQKVAPIAGLSDG